jgi:tRNA(Ile)-lysidine synthase
VNAADLLDTSQLPGRDAPLLVAVSGGLDSVTLTHCLSEAGFSVVIGHVHHGLRESADRDEALTRDLAIELGCRFESVRLHLEKKPGKSLQEEAREARYAALGRMADQVGATGLVTAHHADDQAETVLINLARGAGPRGLGGMAAVSPVPGRPDLTLYRPLLERTREEIEGLAQSRGFRWHEDPSNRDVSYRRNAIRTTLLPVLHEIFGRGASRAIARSARLLRDYENTELAPMSEKLLESARQPLETTFLRTDGFMLLEQELTQLEPVWRNRLLLESLNESGLEAPRDEQTANTISALLESQPGRHVAFSNGAVWREREGLAFVRAGDSALQSEPRSVLPGEEGLPYGRLTFRSQSASYYYPPETWCVTVPATAPCVIRRWKDGDKISLNQGTAKVKDLLTEARVPSHVRADYPVVEQHGAVVWVPYIRASWMPEDRKRETSWVRVSALLD